MTSTELNVGLPGSSRPSSRVLKPPGGGHSNIFAEPEVVANPPRPKYDQQNSSNLNFVMNTLDPNESVQKTREGLEKEKQCALTEKPKTGVAQVMNNIGDDKTNEDSQQNSKGRARVPPGGFSSGLW